MLICGSKLAMFFQLTSYRKRMASYRNLSPRRGTAAVAKGDKLDWWRTCRSSVHIWKQPRA